MRRYGRRQIQVHLLNERVSILKERAGTGLTFADLGTKRDVLGSSTLYLFLGRHVDGLSRLLSANVVGFSAEERSGLEQDVKY